MGRTTIFHYDQYGCTDSSQIFPQLLPSSPRNPVSSKSTTTFPRRRRLSDIAIQTMAWDLQTWGRREEKRDVPSMCVRDETRSARHLGNKIKTNKSCRAGEDVLAGVSVPGTSRPVLVSCSIICSCAFNTKPCEAAGTNIWQREGMSTAGTLSHATVLPTEMPYSVVRSVCVLIATGS